MSNGTEGGQSPTPTHGDRTTMWSVSSAGSGWGKIFDNRRTTDDISQHDGISGGLVVGRDVRELESHIGFILKLVVELFSAFSVTKNGPCMRNGVVSSPVFGFECARSHASQGLRRANLDQSLENKLGK
jgi:hypothetical protein